MISFDLSCRNGHVFEAWFSSSDAFAQQQAAKLIPCPTCGNSTVSKALSAPNVGRKANQLSSKSTAVTARETAPAEASTGAIVSNAEILPAAMQPLLEKLAAVQGEILKKSHWVGREFAEEARAIHYGESEDRMIHGETSHDEAEALHEEGISIAPVLFPFVPPHSKN